MNKKTRKLLTWCLVVSMVLTQMLFTNMAFAATRTSGEDRYKTAIATSQANFTSADTVILARGDDAADALAASPVAFQKKAPILLTETASLSDGVLAEIQRLGAKNVTIAGGTGAVSANDESALKNAGLTVTRVAGADRYDTSLQLAKMLTGVNEVVVINGNSFADALSIAPIAAAKGMAILSTDGQSMSADMKAFVGTKKVTIVGGSAVVADSVFSGAARLAGSDRYATNSAVINAYLSDLKFDKVYFATGEDFPDALSGSVVAAMNGSALVLVGSSLSSDMATLLKSKATKDSAFVIFGGTGAVSGSVESAIDGVFSAPANNGPVSVSSVKAIAADTMEVDFSSVPADTSKVVFTVQRETTPVTVTTTWNGSVATLKYSSKFPQGNYTVNVKNDATDLGTTNVTIDQEKVSKIDITTDKFAVATDGKTGYFTYTVQNQYGEDITNKNLASINWTVPGVGAGDIADGTDVKGVIIATVPNGNQFNFLNLSSITITGVDTSANVVVTKTLGVSASVGTLSSIKLVEVTNTDNKALQAGDTSSKWDITYEAADLAGNLTSNFTLLKGGLVDQNAAADANSDIILSTSGYVHAKMVNQSGIGVIELTVDSSADSLTSDVPVTVTAITKNGSTSTLNLTLKKKSMPTSFTMMAPAEDVSYGQAKEVPFVCYDADGKQLTSYDDVVTNPASITLSPLSSDGVAPGLYFTKKANGDAKLMYQAAPDNNYTQDQTVTLSATTNTGKFSSVTINVRKLAKASTLTVNTSSMVTRIAVGGDIRLDKGFFTVKDQYGRVVYLSQGASGNLYVTAQAAGGDADPNIAVVHNLTNNDNKIVLEGKSTDSNNDGKADGGTSTVKFSLIQKNADNSLTTVATQSVDFTVVKLSDIKGLKMVSGADGATLYDTYNVSQSDPTNANNVYQQKYKVYGVDGNANLVILPADQISSANATTVVSKSNDYLTTATPYDKNVGDDVAVGNSDDYNKVLVQAYAKDLGDTDQSTVVTVSTLIGTDIRSTSFTLKLSKAEAIAQSISAPDEIDLSHQASGDKLTDAITVLDQYGKDMAERRDSTVTVYTAGADGVMHKMVNGYAKDTTLWNIVNSGVKAITIVDNNGHSVSVNIKADIVQP